MHNPELIRPIVTINGTSRAELIEQRMNARRAVFAAMGALSLMRPHGRDYQTDKCGRYLKDRAIYEARYATLDALWNTLELEALAIFNDQDACGDDACGVHTE